MIKKNIFKNNKKIFDKILNTYPDILLGKHTCQVWSDDPKHLLFSLSRYKFVSKMLADYKNVLEVGAGDGFQSRIVDVVVKNLVLSDNLKMSEKFFQKNYFNKNKYLVIDFTKKLDKKLKNKFDGIYCLDVIEHIHRFLSNKFIKNINYCLKKKGTVIIGTPTKESQKYASKLAKAGHVNVYSKNELKEFLKPHYSNVFLFSMNDEVVHTGFDKMSHYVFALCTK
jgi:2-polyprenyl-3-methyl-5-hydroxy-6-metoxy-1,4-benzoquinol methylase